jgi:hypothetical protein
MIQVPTWRLSRAMATRKKMVQVPTGRLELTLNPVKLLVHQRGSLIATTRLLAQAALIAEQEDRRHYFTIATIICAQTAAECILNEWAHDVDPATYSQFVQEQWGFVRIAEELLPKIAGTLPPNTLVLINMKNALSHPQPEHSRSVQVGTWVTGDGAQRALAVVESLDAQFFPNGTPAAVR